MFKLSLEICKKLLPELQISEFLHHAELRQILYDKYFKPNLHLELLPVNNEELRKLERELFEMPTNQSIEIPITNNDVWIFGYGSLVWKADFPYIDRRRGFVCGYQRHFHQHSIDHRGIASKPGRVATLKPTGKLEDRVYGMAYRIAAQQKDDVLEHLDYREKNGYERCTLKFHEFPESIGNCFDVMMYIATCENESYAGDVWQLPLIADQIFTSSGPSGTNREYLLRLASAMRLLFPGVEDKHLYDLEKEVLRRIRDVEPGILESVIKCEIEKILAGDREGCEIRDMRDESFEITLEKAVKELENLKARTTQLGWREAVLTKEYLKPQQHS